mgnify:CR=1 FL=1
MKIKIKIIIYYKWKEKLKEKSLNIRRWNYEGGIFNVRF